MTTILSAPERGSAVDCAQPLRVAHVVSHPIQYFAPLYRALSQRPEVDLTVYFLSDSSLRSSYDAGFGMEVQWDSDLTSGYRYRVLKDAQGRPVRAGLRQAPHWRVLLDLVVEPYDVIWLHGYHHITLALAVILGRLRGRRVILRDDQTFLEPRSRLKQAIKEVGVRALFSGIEALYVGEESRRFFRHFGVSDNRLHRVPYAVDPEMFAARVAEMQGERESLRGRLGIDDDAPAVLFVGKLLQRKAPLDLLRAFERVRSERPCWLVFAGEGEERGAIEAEISRRQIPNVIMAGFTNQSVLPDIYSAVDIFVLPSLCAETWGLVVNEAMTFGLPIVVSDHVGSAPDLVRPGWNGFVTRAGDVENLADVMGLLVETPELRRRMGENSRRRIALYSVQAATDAIVAAAWAR